MASRGFTQVPVELDDLRITAPFFRYIVRVLRRAGRDGMFHESPKRAAHELRISRTAAYSYRRLMARLGMLELVREGRQGAGNVAVYQAVPWDHWPWAELRKRYPPVPLKKEQKVRGADKKGTQGGLEKVPTGTRSISVEVDPLRREREPRVLTEGKSLSLPTDNNGNGNGNDPLKEWGLSERPFQEAFLWTEVEEMAEQAQTSSERLMGTVVRMFAQREVGYPAVLAALSDEELTKVVVGVKRKAWRAAS